MVRELPSNDVGPLSRAVRDMVLPRQLDSRLHSFRACACLAKCYDGKVGDPTGAEKHRLAESAITRGQEQGSQLFRRIACKERRVRESQRASLLDDRFYYNFVSMS